MGSFAMPRPDSVLRVRHAQEAAAGGDTQHRLHIDRRGVWRYGGSPFVRKEMVCLLASCLRKTATGEYEVSLPNEPRPIPVDVDDVPFLAVELFCAGSGAEQILSMRTNVDHIVSIGPDNPMYLAEDPDTGEEVPYIDMGQGMSARISRTVFYELVALADMRDVAGSEEVGVWSNRQFFVLGSLI